MKRLSLSRLVQFVIKIPLLKVVTNMKKVGKPDILSGLMDCTNSLLEFVFTVERQTGDQHHFKFKSVKRF